MMPKLHLRKPVMLSAAVSSKAQEQCRFPVLSPQSNKMADVVFSNEYRIGNAEHGKLVPNTEIVPTLHTD